MTRTKAAMFFRGMSKVMFIAIAVNLFLTNIFEYLAQTLDLGLDNQAVTLFSCVTCGLLTLWLQSDARRAFALAQTNGYVRAEGESRDGLRIAADCPKRRHVIKHVELNSAALR
jgi:hypothetical protein